MIKKDIGKINGIDYNEYIHSDEWKRKRILVAQRENHRCQMCGELIVVHYHIHHKTYARFGNEDLDDLMFLCEDCHINLHREKDKAMGKIKPQSQKKKRKLAVNKRKHAKKKHKPSQKHKKF